MSVRDSFNRSGTKGNSGEAVAYYDTVGTVRTVCFVQTDGQKMFFNYNYMSAGAYDPRDNPGSITLTFSERVVTLLGHNLEPLFDQFNKQTVETVRAVGDRYAQTGGDKPLVTDITVEVQDFTQPQ